MSLCSNAWETRWQCAPNVLQMFSKCGPQCVPSNLPWKWFGGADQRPQFAELDNLTSRSWWGVGNKLKQPFELWKEKTWYISSGNFLMETFDLGTCAETRLRLHHSPPQGRFPPFFTGGCHHCEIATIPTSAFWCTAIHKQQQQQQDINNASLFPFYKPTLWIWYSSNLHHWIL